MKILTTIRRVPDLDARFSLNDDKTEIDTEALDHKINYFDEVALEEAIRISEDHDVDEIVSVCVGPAEASKQLRTALAMGANRAIHVEADEKELDAYLVAAALKAIIADEEPDLVILGKLGVDFESNQVAQLLAGMLNWPQATFAYNTELDEDGESITVGREVDGGSVTFKMPLPAVVTADLRLNEPRYPSVAGIMGAGRKPLDNTDLDDLDVEATPRVTTVRFEEPAQRDAGVVVESVDELVAKLKEAKVI